MANMGKFIVIDGIDGSGKTEQFKKLMRRLKKENIKSSFFDFPQYKSDSSYFIRKYLNGEYGGANNVSPYAASLFYAMDRYDASGKIRKAISKSEVVISNRYTASNFGHQGGKISGKKEREKYFRWAYNLEYNILGIPKPDITIILHMPSEIAGKLVERKGYREYIHSGKKDIHESDIKHLKRAEMAYLEIARKFPKDFRVVRCVKKTRNGDILMSVDEIHKNIWRLIRQTIKI